MTTLYPPHNNFSHALRKLRQPSVMDLDNIITKEKTKDSTNLPLLPLPSPTSYFDGPRPQLLPTPSAPPQQQQATDYFSYQPNYHHNNPHPHFNQPSYLHSPHSPMSPYEGYHQYHAQYPTLPFGHPYQAHPHTPASYPHHPHHPHPLAQPPHYAPPVYSPSYPHPPPAHSNPVPNIPPTTPSAAPAPYVHTPLKPKRKRASPSQLAALNAVFEKTFFPSTQLRLKLARELAMTPRAVQIWFQNKRQAWRVKNKGQLLKEDEEEAMDDDKVDAEGSSISMAESPTTSTSSLPGIAALTPLSPEARPDYFSSSSSESSFSLDENGTRPPRHRTTATDMDVKEFNLRMPEGKGMRVQDGK